MHGTRQPCLLALQVVQRHRPEIHLRLIPKQPGSHQATLGRPIGTDGQEGLHLLGHDVELLVDGADEVLLFWCFAVSVKIWAMSLNAKLKNKAAIAL